MSFVDVIEKGLRNRPGDPSLVEILGERLRSVSGGELRDRALRARGWLQAHDVGAGERVGLLGPNSASWVAADLALLSHGAVSVPLYARQDPRELAGMLRDSGTRVLWASDEALAKSVVDAGAELRTVCLFDELFEHEPGSEVPHALDERDPVSIIYTSGTSGEPKGVVLHAGGIDYMLNVTVERIARLTSQRAEPDRVFHYLPFCFAGSRIMLWSQLYRGNPLMMSTDLNNLVQEMGAAQPHYFMNVPAVLERVRNGVSEQLSRRPRPVRALFARAEQAYRRSLSAAPGPGDRLWLSLGKRLLFPQIRRAIGSRLEFLVCGSAPLNEETQRWFQMLGIAVYQIYGLTETTAIVTIDDPDAVRPGYVGRVIDGCEIRLSDEGELLCRGPNLFAGYWNRPEATAKAMQGGWFHTGDQAEIDASGHVKIVGRLKDVIVPESGHNVAPAPIEQQLVNRAPGIEHALVVGQGRPYLTALVTGSVSEQALERAIEEVNQDLPHYKRIRRAQRVDEPFTVENGLLTANQKLRRQLIERRHQDTIRSMYA